MAEICTEDIKAIKNFAQNVLQKIIPSDEYEKYYYIFKSKPHAYTILAVNKKIIYMIAEYCKSCKQSTLSSQREISDASSDLNMQQLLLQKMSVDITEDNKFTLNTVKNYIKSKCENNEEWLQYKILVKDIQLSTRLTDV